MSKYGKHVIVNPISRDETYAQTIFGDGAEIHMRSNSFLIDGSVDPLSYCINAIKRLKNEEAAYANVEMFTDMHGISRVVLTLGSDKDVSI